MNNNTPHKMTFSEAESLHRDMLLSRLLHAAQLMLDTVAALDGIAEMPYGNAQALHRAAVQLQNAIAEADDD